jgi:hypothetical protein
MAAIVAPIKRIWVRFAWRGTKRDCLAGLGPNQCKEARLPPEAGSWMR